MKKSFILFVIQLTLVIVQLIIAYVTKWDVLYFICPIAMVLFLTSYGIYTVSYDDGYDHGHKLGVYDEQVWASLKEDLKSKK